MNNDVSKSQPGDIVQIGPTYRPANFCYCFLVVEEVRSWGVKGYVAGPHPHKIGKVTQCARYPVRVTWEQIHWVGKAHWFSEDVKDAL